VVDVGTGGLVGGVEVDSGLEEVVVGSGRLEESLGRCLFTISLRFGFGILSESSHVACATEVAEMATRSTRNIL
jgi:hypothetical protein